MKSLLVAPTVRSIAAQSFRAHEFIAPKARSIAAQGNALGIGIPRKPGALLRSREANGRPNSKGGDRRRIGRAPSWVALSGLRAVSWPQPRALPWAAIGCPFGAEESVRVARVDQHLQKMVAVWK